MIESDGFVISGENIKMPSVDSTPPPAGEDISAALPVFSGQNAVQSAVD